MRKVACILTGLVFILIIWQCQDLTKSEKDLPERWITKNYAIVYDKPVQVSGDVILKTFNGRGRCSRSSEVKGE